MPPSGIVTFLFTDIEGSTKLAQNFPDMLQTSLEKHNEIMLKAIESNNGFVFEAVGDAFCCAFENVWDAVKAAVDAQINLAKEKFLTAGQTGNDAVIKVRIGIHSGNAEWNGKDYMGYITLARTARVMSAAYGEQILISNDTYELLGQGVPNQEIGNKVDIKVDNLKDSKTQSKNDLIKSSSSLRDLEVSFRDLGERRLKDLNNPVRLFQILSDELRSEFPSLKTLDARPNNLPVQLNSFIGREKELKHAKKLLKKTHLLTLTGSGGAGKTRFALQLGADIIDDFANGVWIIELAGVTEPAILPQLIMKIFGLKEEPNKSPEDSLFDYLREKEILIILDNCEHMIVHCAVLIEKLLIHNPKMKIIATSREAMNCAGEQLYRIPSLTFPDTSVPLTAETLTQYESVRLFIERALAINKNFRVNNSNAPALAEICNRLDGIPLAIELAAARTKILTIEKIYERLNDRFNLLTGGKRTVLPRQQTLRALIDWSYDLLSDKEKLLLQRLSVFSGGWTLEAAEEICSDEKIESSELMDIHINLQDKSLINSNETSIALRFYLLETIREYSGEKLDDKPTLSDRHLKYFRRISDYGEMKANESVQQVDWIKLVENDLSNIRAAIEWAIPNEPNEAINIANNLSEFWNIKGYFSEALRTYQNLLKLNLPVDDILKAGVLLNTVEMHINLGNFAEAELNARECLSFYTKINYNEGLADCLNLLGIVTHKDNTRLKESKKYYEDALAIYRELKSEMKIATVLNNLSYILSYQGNNEKSLEYKLEALSIRKALNDKHNIAFSLASLCRYEIDANNFESAKAYAEESLSISNECGDNYLISVNLVNLGNILLKQEEYEKAFIYFNDSLVMMKEYGYRSNAIVSLKYLGDVSIKLGNPGKAIDYFRESVIISRETGSSYFLASLMLGLSISHYDLKEFEASLKYILFFRNLIDNRKDQLAKAEEQMSNIREKLGNEIYERILNEVNEIGKDKIMDFVINELKNN